MFLVWLATAECQMSSVAGYDVWGQILRVLARVSSNNEQCNESELWKNADALAESWRSRSIGYGRSYSTVISILERYTPNSLSICWHDATLGRYGDQRWRLQIARRKTICAMTGRTIRRGDMVYGPHSKQQCSANASHLILAEALDKLERNPHRQPAAKHELDEKVTRLVP